VSKGVRVLKPRNANWGELFKFEDDDEEFDYPLELELDEQAGEGIMILEEAHEALNRLSQKTNKRGRLMKQPRKAESWQ
jgi:hypothetical protein